MLKRPFGTNFIGLTDSPADYIGETLKGARVNAAEDALEFAAVAGERTYPHSVNYVLFSGNCPTVFTDLDCTEDEGAIPTGVIGPAWVLLKVKNTAAGAAYAFKEKGETDVMPNPGNPTLTTLPGVGGILPANYTIVPTDSDGKIQWLGDVAQNTVITLLRYWNSVSAPKAVIFNGDASDTWRPLNTGVPNALVIIKLKGITAVTYKVRMRGEAVNCGLAGVTYVNITGVNYFGYMIVPTDSAGYIEYWGGHVTTATCEITLHSYILGCSFPNQSIANTKSANINTWVDVPTPFPNAVLFMAQYPQEAGFGDIAMRLNGDADRFNYDGGTQFDATFALTYGVIITDGNGVFEFADQNILTHLVAKCVSQGV